MIDRVIMTLKSFSNVFLFPPPLLAGAAGEPIDEQSEPVHHDGGGTEDKYQNISRNISD